MPVYETRCLRRQSSREHPRAIAQGKLKKHFAVAHGACECLFFDCICEDWQMHVLNATDVGYSAGSTNLIVRRAAAF